MLVVDASCDDLVDLDYSNKFKSAGGYRMIIQKGFDKYSGLAPVADIRTDKYNEYNLNYRCFNKRLTDLDQIILTSLIIQYETIPLVFRGIQIYAHRLIKGFRKVSLHKKTHLLIQMRFFICN